MSMVDVHSGHRERLRARYMKEGLDFFEDHQVLELILFYSISRKDTNETAHKLLEKFGSLARVFEATPEELMQVEGIGVNSAVLLSCVTDLTRRYNESRHRSMTKFHTAEAAGIYAMNLLRGRANENLYVICLNSKCELINTVKITEGTIDQVTAYPRRVVEAALQCKAHSVILTHNHPGGESRPSQADIETTNAINAALCIVDIELRDHIIVGEDRYSSFKELKML